MVDKIKFGIVGMGARGKKIAEIFLKNDNIDLTAVCDNDDTQLKEWKKKSIDTYKDYDRFLQDSHVDAVFIATPDSMHVDMVLKASKMNKHILCEKPIGINKDEVTSMYNEIKGRDNVFLAGYVLRYAPLLQKVKKLIEGGVIGKLVNVEATDHINYGGYAFFHDWHRKKVNTHSLLLQKATHSLDIIKWMVDSKPKLLAAFGGLDVFGSRGAISLFGHTIGNDLHCCECDNRMTCGESIENCEKIKDIKWSDNWPDSCVYSDEVDVEDNFTAMIQYENDVKLSYTLCLFTPEYKREYIFLGDKGKLQVDDTTNTITITYRGSKDTDIYKVVAQGNHMDGDEGLVEDFIKCFYTKSKPIASLEDSVISTLTALELQDSVDHKKIVTFSL